jgi:hypothetical protein
LLVSIELDLDFHQHLESNFVPITTLPPPSTPPTGCRPDLPSALTQQKRGNLPPSTQEHPFPVQLPTPIVSNDTTTNTCTTTTSITPSPSKLKSKYPLYKSLIQPKTNEVVPSFVKVDKRKEEKVSIEESGGVAKQNYFASGNSTDSSDLFEDRRKMKRARNAAVAINKTKNVDDDKKPTAKMSPPKKKAAPKKKAVPKKKAAPKKKEQDTSDDMNKDMNKCCLQCMQKLNICHEEFYGGYCVANVWKLWYHYGHMTTINNVKKRYHSPYTEAVRVLTYFKHNILKSEKVLEPPPCMLNGSFVKAVEKCLCRQK